MDPYNFKSAHSVANVTLACVERRHRLECANTTYVIAWATKMEKSADVNS